MNYEERIQLIKDVFMSWVIRELDNPDQSIQDESEASYVHKIMRKKIEWFSDGLKESGVIKDPIPSDEPVVIAPTELIICLCIMSDWSPGIIQVMFKKILDDIKNAYGHLIKVPYKITTNDFARTFYEFDAVDQELPEEEWSDFTKYWISVWNQQKTEYGRNKVDFMEYWIEPFCYNN